MAKKTTKTPAKTATKKPVTNEEILEYLKVVRSNILRRINDIEDRLDPRMDKIERLLSTPKDVTGSPVDIKVTIPEQGLEPGDYTDASKEVADALTAMGFKMMWAAYTEYPFISFNERVNEVFRTRHENTVKLTPAEFLSRAAVTAKEVGLVPAVEKWVPKEEEPWKPEVGELVVCECDDFPETCPRGTIGPVICLYPNGAIDTVGLNGASRHMYPKERRKPTPEEVAKYHADKEAAKPIGPYVTRVMCDGYEWRVICGMDQLKRYRIHRIEGEFEYCVSVQRHEFTVIDP
jgi:hypothetical protein